MGRPVLLLVFILLLPAVAAQDCGSVLTELRGFTSPLLSSQPEFAQVKQDVLLLLYSRERGACGPDMAGFASLTLEYLREAHEAYLLMSSGVLSERRSGVERLVEAANLLAEMESYASTLGPVAEDAVFAAREGRRGLLLAQGMSSERMAEESPGTREKLEHLELAIMSYEAADALQAKSLEVRRQNLEERYTADMAEAARHLEEASIRLRRAVELRDAFPGFIDAYALAREARLELLRAGELYSLHREEEMLRQVESSLSTAQEIYTTSRRRILLLFALVAAVLTSLSVYIQSRIRSWERDNHECSLGNELVGV
ncbi:MAG: hypothetical protein GXO66_09735 [Euryarchaeota archaeon]|nr:hypothetical protein [Euryarchaeota archaeon]